MSFSITLGDLTQGPVDPSIISKIVTPVISGYKGKQRAKDIILPAPRAWNGLRYTTQRDYQDEKIVAMVLNNGEFTEISGDQQLLKDYKPQSFKLKTSFSVDELREYAYLNDPKAISANFQTKAFSVHKRIMDNSKNALTILHSKGGVTQYPINTGEGGMKLTDMNFGKIHSNAATDRTLNSVTITGNWGAATAWTTIENDINEILAMFDDKGVDANRVKFLHSQESWDAMIKVLTTINTTTNSNPNVSAVMMERVDVFTRIINGVTHMKVNDSVIVNGTTYNLVDSKKILVVGDKEYHDNVYLTPSTGRINTPTEYFAYTETAGALLDTYIHYSLSKPFIFVDTNAICELQVIA